MATNIVTLTDVFQQVSSGACYIQPDSNVLFGFGATEPTVSHKFRATSYSDAINYNGNYGAIWLKRSTPSHSVQAIVTVVLQFNTLWV